MTYSGQCPVCRETLVFDEASVVAAPVEPDRPGLRLPTIRCDCSAFLVAQDLSESTEISAECRQCGSKYVVDRSGAGEALPCRCGATVVIPTAILVEIPGGAFESELTQDQPERPDTDQSPSGKQLSPSIVRLPIAPIPELYQIRLPPIADRPKALPRRMELPIVTVPTLYAIEIPEPTPEPTQPDREVATDLDHESDSAVSESVVIACPGCGRSYEIETQEMGRSAECECGFVFVLKEDTEAIDHALRSDLMPFPPLAIDRTGSNVSAAEMHPKRVADAFDSVMSRSERIRRRSRVGSLFRLLFGAAAGFLLVFAAMRIADRNRADRSDPLLTQSQSTPQLPAPFVPAEVESVEQPPTSFATSAAARERPGPTSSQQIDEALSEFLLPLREYVSLLEPETVLDRSRLSEFGDRVTKLDLEGVEFSVRDLFWLAESWEDFAARAENDDLRSKCFWQAASAYAYVQTLESIASSESELARERQQDLSVKSRAAARVAAGSSEIEVQESLR